nr:immunoglobulin light chain junction region [Macaca mulatta]MOX78073.1 immunoglobulin light chain junction region [Macaca mulatta]MOX78243.1 immunoglobulin light chain junction region [Macaca mulatta]MOX78623.1 immunoglobulin light chain junction region [Macaca mulatta]MOX78736.1 immunoglobulin light chain junction region [Macaca mulatta]
DYYCSVWDNSLSTVLF